MKKGLIIVESPTKAKTIGGILGSEYRVMATMGHIRDLPQKEMGVNIDKDFEPKYVLIPGKKTIAANLKKAAGEHGEIYLATDEDREGEAICWHIKNQLEKSAKNADIFRVSFEEITEKAVKEAFEHPRQLDMKKINAQQARRILDRIVGYSLSPLLWGKVTRGLSAGRVQSVAVKLIADREEEIKKFKSQEYWSLDAILRKRNTDKQPDTFAAKLVKHKGEKIHISDKDTAERMIAELEKEKYVVSDVLRKEKKSHPRSPYTTSLLQQEAFNKINFSASKTMRIAQELYEGIDLGACPNLPNQRWHSFAHPAESLFHASMRPRSIERGNSE